MYRCLLHLWQKGQGRVDEAALRIDVGLTFARKRASGDLSQERLAALAGCSHSTIGRLERGEAVPPLATLMLIGAALGMSSAQVIFELEHLRYRQRVLEALLLFGTHNHAAAGVIVMILAGTTFDQQACRQLARALLIIRKDLLTQIAATPIS